MGLFVKKITEQSRSFNLGASKTLLIAGLGNIGQKYDNTRHNIGFACLEALHNSHSEFTSWQDKKSLHCELSSGIFGQTKVILVKPTTFMNQSGRAVKSIASYYKIQSNRITVVHDELDLTFGQIKTKVGGGSAGHNGVQSIISQIGDNFGRIRIGIGPKSPDTIDSAEFVLAKFNKEEQSYLTPLTREVQSLLTELIYRGELYPDSRNFIV